MPGPLEYVHGSPQDMGDLTASTAMAAANMVGVRLTLAECPAPERQEHLDAEMAVVLASNCCV
jgi:hypothetical protein